MVRTQYAAYLLTGGLNGSASAGAAIDTRFTRNYGLLQYATPVQSAVITLQASVDETGWVNALTVSATTTTAITQVTAYYPYVRAIVNAIYSGGGNTGFPVVYYAAGMN